MKQSKTQVAQELGVSRTRLYTMIKEGIVSPEADGTIDIILARTSMQEKLSSTHGGKRTSAIINENFSEARTRKEKALADMRELEVAEKRGDFLNAEEVKAALAETFIVIKERIRSIPARYSTEIYHIAKSMQKENEAIAKIFETLLKDIDETLLELSRFRPPTNRKGGVKKKVV